jgi:hypothetical protein
MKLCPGRKPWPCTDRDDQLKCVSHQFLLCKQRGVVLRTTSVYRPIRLLPSGQIWEKFRVSIWSPLRSTQYLLLSAYQRRMSNQLMQCRILIVATVNPLTMPLIERCQLAQNQKCIVVSVDNTFACINYIVAIVIGRWGQSWAIQVLQHKS